MAPRFRICATSRNESDEDIYTHLQVWCYQSETTVMVTLEVVDENNRFCRAHTAYKIHENKKYGMTLLPHGVVNPEDLIVLPEGAIIYPNVIFKLLFTVILNGV
jgi:L-fucose mutarotase/ribose pyranase (RbsD/FucU family)